MNGQILVDFVRSSIDRDVYLRLPPAGGNVRDVTYKNKLIGALQITRPKISLPVVSIYNGRYTRDTMPFGGSSNSDEGIAILLHPDAETSKEIALFESIEQAIKGRKHV